jgi:hypothetical protein
MNTTGTVNEMPTTSMKVQMNTRDRLMDLGKKGESYDTIINRLIDFYKQHQKEEEK